MEKALIIQEVFMDVFNNKTADNFAITCLITMFLNTEMLVQTRVSTLLD